MCRTGYLTFSLGMVGERLFRDTPALLLMVFMTNQLGIPPALAGAAIFVPKLLVVVADPLVGRWSDALQTRWGPRRPPMLAGALLSALSLVALFHVPPLPSPLTRAVYLSALLMAGFAGYALFCVPYLSLASEVARTEEQRRQVMSSRVAFMAVGLCLSAFGGGLLEYFGNGVEGYRKMAWAYGAVALLTMLASVFSPVDAPVRAAASTPVPLRQALREVWAVVPYRHLLGVGALQKLGEGVGYGSFAYFCLYVVEQPLSGIGIVVLAATIGQILGQPLWIAASRRYSKPTLYCVGVIGWCLNLFLWLGMKGAPTWWLIPLGLQGGLAAGGFLMVTLTLFAKISADRAGRTGAAHEGLLSGIWLATEKIGFAAGALIVGLMLSSFGFVESNGSPSVAQSPTAVLGIAITYCGINAAIYLASIVAMGRLSRSASDRVVGFA